MLDVRFVDVSWYSGWPPELGARLNDLLDNPQG
jgi:hypothetical protein